MARDLSTIVVMDVEATCWENDADATRASSEIIEIGVCELRVHDHGSEIGPAESFLVNPQRSKVSEFCTRLTTITQEMVDGAPFYDAVARTIIAKYKTQHRITATWGDYDRNMFQKHHDKWLAPYLLGPTHWNVKSIFAVAHGLAKEVPVARALELIKQPFEGTPHRGVDDARNIAKLLQHLLRRLI